MPDVMTTRGPIAPAELGRTLPHEHFFVNLMKERRGDGWLADEPAITEEVAAFAAQGGRTIFELSSTEVAEGTHQDQRGRSDARESRPAENVLACARVAQAAGVAVVLGTGHYREPYLHADVLDECSTPELAEHLIRDLTEGFPGTGVRAGIIGEVGANAWYVTAREERSFRAAARAHRATGRPIYAHAVFGRVAEQELDILAEEGVDPARVAIAHVDISPVDGLALDLARRGAYVGIDSIQSSNEAAVASRVRRVLELVRAGHLEQVLLSHDLCMPSHLRRNGGNGLLFVNGGFRDRLLEAGLSAEEFDVITVDNPARFAAV